MTKNIVIEGNNVTSYLAVLILLNNYKHVNINHLIPEQNSDSHLTILSPSYIRLLKRSNQDIPLLIKATSAQYILGTKLHQWTKNKEFSTFFLPHNSDLDRFYQSTFFNNIEIRNQGYDIVAHPDEFNFLPQLIKANLSPIEPYHFPFENEYSLVIETIKLTAFIKNVLAKHEGNRLKTIINEVMSISVNHSHKSPNELVLLNNQILVADMLISTTLQSKLMPSIHELDFPDLTSSITLTFDHSTVAPIPLYIDHIACTEGDIAFIPSSSFIKATFRYNSKILTKAKAVQKLLDIIHQNYNEKLSIIDSDITYGNKLQYFSQHMLTNNQVYLGRSYSHLNFSEIMQAELDAFLMYQLLDYIDNDCSPSSTLTINNAVAAYTQTVIDFQQAFYLLSNRPEQLYSTNMKTAHNCSKTLKRLIQHWLQGKAITEDLLITPNIASIQQWNTIFAGLGIFPAPETLVFDETLKQFDINEQRQFYQNCLQNFSKINEQGQSNAQ